MNGEGPYKYRVNHLHMHGPAEHRLDGVQHDLEVHIVHELVDGPENWKEYHHTLAVVGLFFKVSDHSHPFIEKLKPIGAPLTTPLSLNELFKNNDQNNANEFFHYKGSLTNPPCADVVNWILYRHVLPITAEHLETFKSVWMTNLGFGNYRDCQPLAGRKIVRNFELQEEIHNAAYCAHHVHAHDKHKMHY